MSERSDYETVRVLKKTDDVEVRVVQHKALGVMRIMKIVSCQGKESLPEKEAILMAQLSHEGIPILYDLYEEDGKRIWIEELVEGEPLSEYLMRHVPTEEEIVHVMCALTSILHYLHTREPVILYQDLKPEHIYLKGERVVLIDYGIAGDINQVNEDGDAYGSRSYAAPEKLVGQSVDERTDLYSLGIIAGMMVKRRDGDVSREMKSLIRRALRENPDERPGSVLEWGQSFQKLAEENRKKTLSKQKSMHLPKEIAVIGMEDGVGCTHFAISLVVLFNHAGIQAYYENPTQAVAEKIHLTEDAFEEEKGIIYHDCFTARVTPRAGLADYEPPKGIRIIDCGTDGTLYPDADLRIGVVGSSLWKMRVLEDWKNRYDLMVVNPSNREAGRIVAKQCQVLTLGFPVDSDAFYPSREKMQFFRTLKKEVMG